MKKPCVFIKTLGCKLNQADSAAMIQSFLDHGYRLTSSPESADVVVINTCTVTARADAKCRQEIRHVARVNPAATLIVSGCYPQASAQALAAIPGVDYILGVSEKASLFDHFSGPGKRPFPYVSVGDVREGPERAPTHPGLFPDQTRAYLTIQTGCNRRCSYCIVPLVRGPSRSFSSDFVLASAKTLIDRGFKEIVLTGVHVGDFGKDRSGRSELPDLLRRLVSLDPGVRWRLSSLDPEDLTEELIQAVADLPQVCRHFHVALQSGSDAILAAMGRRHTTDDFRQTLRRLHRVLGPVGLGADLIVGFPGETEALFEETVSLVRSSPFTYLHVFPFSPRPGTKAATLSGQIPPSIRLERARFLRHLGQEKKAEFLASLVGKTLQVLFETILSDGRMNGLSSEYARVVAPAEPEWMNRIVPIEIIRADPQKGVLIGKKT